LQDPVLEFHDDNGALVSTNDTGVRHSRADIIATGIPPTDDRESAILTTLQPGSYTAIVRGQNNTTSVALVEVYNVDAASTTVAVEARQSRGIPCFQTRFWPNE
jgi:hypothetical protein